MKDDGMGFFYWALIIGFALTQVFLWIHSGHTIFGWLMLLEKNAG